MQSGNTSRCMHCYLEEFANLLCKTQKLSRQTMKSCEAWHQAWINQFSIKVGKTQWSSTQSHPKQGKTSAQCSCKQRNIKHLVNQILLSSFDKMFVENCEMATCEVKQSCTVTLIVFITFIQATVEQVDCTSGHSQLKYTFSA